MPFRLWDEDVFEETGQLICTKYLIGEDWEKKISLGSKRYHLMSLNSEYRLKK